MVQIFERWQNFDQKNDRTTSKRIFELLRAKEQTKDDLLFTLLALFPCMIYIKDVNFRYVYANSKYENFIYSYPEFETKIEHLKKKALKGKRLDEKLEFDSKVLEISLILFHFNSKQMVAGYIQDRTVTARKFEYLSKTIESLKRRYLHFKKCSTIDTLTRALNKDQFEHILHKECDRATRYHTPLSLILFDIDNFKKVNDEYGHIAGDTVLHSIAKSVPKRTRKTNIFGRIGGDEFAILAPETRIEADLALVKKIQESINRLIFQSLDFSSISCSFGVSQYYKSEDPFSFLKRADNVLYISKKEGRDRISWIE